MRARETLCDLQGDVDGLINRQRLMLDLLLQGLPFRETIAGSGAAALRPGKPSGIVNSVWPEYVLGNVKKQGMNIAVRGIADQDNTGVTNVR